MQNLTRPQKLILLVFAVLDVLVIGAMAIVVVNTSKTLPATTPVTTSEANATSTAPPTWTPTATSPPTGTLPPRLTNTPTVAPTLLPTRTPTTTPTLPAPEPITLAGAEFDFVLTNRIPGWEWNAFINYRAGDEADSDTSYAEPMFTTADDPLRQINGGTLKIETERWLKFRAYVYQNVTVTVGSTVYFEIKAKAFSSLDRLIVKAGIDPAGGENCLNARWGNEQRINQDDGVVTLTSPRVVVSAPVLPEPTATEEETETSENVPEPIQGRITVCFFAEPSYAHVNNAAFFDQAELIIVPR